MSLRTVLFPQPEGPSKTKNSLSSMSRLTESTASFTAWPYRFETFNSFNHAQFFGPVAVNGDIDSNLFGQVVKAAPPRLAQIALKFTF